MAAFPASAQTASGPDAARIRADRNHRLVDALRQESAHPLTARFDEATGVLTTLRGRLSPHHRRPEQAAREFLSRHGILFGLTPGLEDLRFERRTGDPGGAVVSFSQEHHGIPVFDGSVLVGFNPDGEIIQIRSTYLPDLHLSVNPRITGAEAIDRAAEEPGSSFDAVVADPRLVVAQGGKGWPGRYLAWEVRTTASNPPGEQVFLVEAEAGAVIRTFDLLKSAGPDCIPCNPAADNNCGSLFFEDPVTFFDDPLLTDTSNVDGALVNCVLPFKTSPNLLDGTYADTQITSPRAGPPYNYLRSVNELAVDEVTSYFHATRAKEYLDSLWFNNVMNYPLLIDAHDAGVGSNAFYSPTQRAVHFGQLGVDFAQDPYVVYHEYGHAIQDDQVTFFGVSLEGGALGEGFGDYWAGALMDGSSTTLLGDACLAPWVTTSIRPYNGTPGSGCLRRLDRTKDYPRDRRFAVHADGEIWSSALWSLRGAVGGGVADSLVIKSHTFLLFNAEFIDNADALLSADTALYGGAHTSQIIQALRDRGIPHSATAAPIADITSSVPFVCETNHAYLDGEYKECVFTQPGASRLRLHFSLFDTEANFDIAHVSDADFGEVQVLSGTPFGAGDGYSAAVWGGTIVARFKADTSVTRAGFTIDAVEYAVGAGETPDGLSAPGIPLSILPLPGGDVTLSWGASCAAGDTDYEVYEGTIGSFASHIPKICGTGGLTSATIIPAAGSSYYLVVPRNTIGEGSYGTRSDGAARPASAAPCLPQEVAVICQ